VHSAIAFSLADNTGARTR